MKNIHDLVTDITNILAEKDYIGLVKMGAPIDEYEPEAQRIAFRITKAFHTVEEVASVIKEAFIHMFDFHISEKQAIDLAVEVHSLIGYENKW